MPATNPADLALDFQKASEGFTTIVDQPTDTNIMDIRQLLLPVLMQTKYNELTLTHNLSWGDSSYGKVQTHLQEGRLFKSTRSCLIQRLDRQGHDKDGSTSGKGET